MHPSKSGLPLHDIREILQSKLFTEAERTRAVNRVLTKWRSLPVFETVLTSGTTFEQYVWSFVEDNLGLGILRRRKLNQSPTPDFVENISKLFDVEMWYMQGRGGIVNRSLISPIRLAVIGPFFWSLLSLVCFAVIVFSSIFAEFWKIWPAVLMLTFVAFLTAAATYSSLDDPFEQKRELAQKLLNDAIELDQVILKYWVKK